MIEVRYPYCSCPRDLSEREAVERGRELARRISGKLDAECGLTPYDIIFVAGRSIALRSRQADMRADVEGAAFLLKSALKGNPVYMLPVEKGEKCCRLGEARRVIVYFDDAPEKFMKRQQKKNASLAKKAIGAITKRKIQKEYPALDFKLLQSLMQSAVCDRMFVAQFNQETFLKGLDVADKPLYTALSALYAITFHGLTPEDIYCVDSIFSAHEQNSRQKDLLKNQSACELVQILNGGGRSCTETLDKMSRALANLSSRQADVCQMSLLAANYTCYAGIANMSAAWVKLLREDKPLADSLRSVQGEDFAPVNEKINRLLCRFSEAVAVCDNIAAGKLKPPFENNTRIT